MLRLFIEFLLFLIFLAFVFSMGAVLLVYLAIGFLIYCAVAFYRGWQEGR